MKIRLGDYDYVMYVDASGDDGFKFDKGSSICYCAAALLVNQQDIAHDLSVLQQIKTTVGCKETDEVKYSKIRRHRRGKEALALLRSIKGRMSCYLMFKKELEAEDIPSNGSKQISIACHTMALRASVTHSMCKNGQKRVKSILYSKNLHNVWPLFPTTSGAAAFNYFCIHPVKMVNQHYYLFCEKK